jgi:RND family efflux transporter MFP subunit
VVVRAARITVRLVAGLAGAMAITACNPAPTPPPPSARSSAESVVDVEAAALRRGAISQRVSASGSVVARRESRIGAEISGTIVRVLVSEGDRVEAGAPLFEIDPAPFAMALRQANAGLDVAQAQRRQLEADVQRAATLRAQNLLAQQELDRLTTSAAVARAEERRATEAVALAHHNLTRTVVHAPYAGSVAERLVDEGTTALVQPQTIVLVLQETAVLEAQAAIPETQATSVHVGDPAIVRVEGVAEGVRTTVAAVNDTIDPGTRTYLVKMPVPNPDHQIKAGVFAHVEIQPEGRSDAVLAPRDAIRVEGGRMRLLVVRDGRAATLPIQVGAVTETDAELLAGADAGELAIVGDAARTVAPGTRVQVAVRDAGAS